MTNKYFEEWVNSGYPYSKKSQIESLLRADGIYNEYNLKNILEHLEEAFVAGMREQSNIEAAGVFG